MATAEPTIADPLPGLYEADEVAWLDESVARIESGRPFELDFENLAEFLSAMARSERRAVQSRIRVLLAHLLKWEFQPEKRTGSWRATVFVQTAELADELKARTLRNHAQAVLPAAYSLAVLETAAKSGLPRETFPATCPYSLDELLDPDALARFECNGRQDSPNGSKWNSPTGEYNDNSSPLEVSAMFQPKPGRPD